MKRHWRTTLAAVVFLALPGFILSPPTCASADGALQLKSVEFPREFKGECDAVFKVDGDLSSAKDLVAEVEYAMEHTAKGSKQNKITKSVRKHKAKQIDAKTGTVIFHVRFKGPGNRMATSTLHYVKDEKPFKTNEVKTSWFSVTEGATTTMEEDE